MAIVARLELRLPPDHLGLRAGGTMCTQLFLSYIYAAHLSVAWRVGVATCHSENQAVSRLQCVATQVSNGLWLGRHWEKVRAALAFLCGLPPTRAFLRCWESSLAVERDSSRGEALLGHVETRVGIKHVCIH